MSSPLKIKKIVWAMDPFEEKLESQSSLVSLLREVSHKLGAAVEPVYVFSLFDEARTQKSLEILNAQQYKHAAEKAIHDVIQGLPEISFLPGKVVLSESYSSTVEEVQSLVNYATGSGAVLVVAGTHARKGLPRLFLGSFAESLVLRSHLPVITVGPHCQFNSLKNILFVSDLSDSSEKAFQRVIALAEGLHTEVTLFHVISQRIAPMFQSGAYLLGGGIVTVPEYISKEEDLKRATADEWAVKARQKGVRVHVSFEYGREEIPEVVLKKAESGKFGMIAMAAESGPIVSTLIGSITRQVVRNSVCPVWVSHLG